VQRVGRFISKNIENDFLWQTVRSDKYLNVLKNTEKGMDIPHLSKDEILSPFVTVPPLPEQQKIASILTSIDDSIQQEQRELQQTQNLKKSLMQDLLTGKVRVKVD